MPDNLMSTLLARLTSVRPGAPGLTTFVNHYSYAIARKDPSLFSRFSSIYVDGIFLTKILAICGARITRCSFDMTSLAPIIFNMAAEQGLKVVLVGGAPEVAVKAGEIFCREFQGLDVVAAYSGFFSSEDARAAVIEEICQSSPDIVICGMGTPLQEKFLVDLSDAGWLGLGYTCGGFLHQTAKKGPQYYPLWIDRFNLRWLYRLIDEPKLIRRYTIDLVKFLFLFSTDLLSLRKQVK